MKSIEKKISKLNKTERKVLLEMVGAGVLTRKADGATLQTKYMAGGAEYGQGQGPTGASRQTPGKRAYQACEALVEKGLATLVGRHSHRETRNGWSMSGYGINIKPTAELVDYVTKMAIWQEGREWTIGLAAPLDLDCFYKVRRVI